MAACLVDGAGLAQDITSYAWVQQAKLAHASTRFGPRAVNPAKWHQVTTSRRQAKPTWVVTENDSVSGQMIMASLTYYCLFLHQNNMPGQAWFVPFM
jgi:hypothetical protein